MVIDAGFVVQSGATVIVKSKGKVIITGGDILNGGSLYIEAMSVDVTKNFNVAYGAKFEVKNNN